MGRYSPGWKPRIENCEHPNIVAGHTLRSPGEHSLTVSGISCRDCGEHVTATWMTASLPDVSELDSHDNS